MEFSFNVTAATGVHICFFFVFKKLVGPFSRTILGYRRQHNIIYNTSIIVFAHGDFFFPNTLYVAKVYRVLTHTHTYEYTRRRNEIAESASTTQTLTVCATYFYAYLYSRFKVFKHSRRVFRIKYSFVNGYTMKICSIIVQTRFR